jgi:hypothetical protein
MRYTNGIGFKEEKNKSTVYDLDELNEVSSWNANTPDLYMAAT